MKKILFFINSLNGGGAERALVNLANGISERGFDVTVISLIGNGVLEEQLSDKVRYRSIVKVKQDFLKRALVYFLSFVLPPSVVHKLFVGNGYDYEVAFLEGVPTKIIGASGNKHSKKYAWVHIDLYNTFGLEKVYRNMDEHRRTYRKFDKILCVSETAKNAFIKRFGVYDNVDVCYNVIDDDTIRKKADEEVLKCDCFTIASVGRLERQKGFDRLIEVMRRLRDDNIKCRLLIVGEGSERLSLENLIKKYDLSDRVELPGFSRNPYKYMKSADLLVFPSLAEGYSTVVAEGLILGKPMVVSRCSGMNELLGESDYGVITEDDNALYNAVKTMIIDDEVRALYSKRAADRAQVFSKDAQLKESIKFFE